MESDATRLQERHCLFGARCPTLQLDVAHIVTPAALDRYRRGFTGHVARATRSIRARLQLAREEHGEHA